MTASHCNLIPPNFNFLTNLARFSVALKWLGPEMLGPEISNHLLGRTPMESDFFHIHPITNEEVLDVDVPRALAA